MTGRPQSIPLGAIMTDHRLQNRNVGMQKYKEHSDAKRYKDHIAHLARDIKARGQQVPLLVVAADEGVRWELPPGADRPCPIFTRYWLVDGHHRLEALRRAGANEVLVEILPGQGIADALDAARRANQQIIQALSPLERTENAWYAMNLERDTYRKLPVKEAAALLDVSENTIKRFRDAVRKEGIAAGKIDPDAPRDKTEQQLQAYWGLKMTCHRFGIITWTQFRQVRKGPATRTSGAARKRIIKMAIIQTLFGEEGRYESKDIMEALAELGREADRPDAAAFLEAKYKPKVYQSTTTDEDEHMEEAFDHCRLGLEGARMHSEGEVSKMSGDF